MTCQEPVAIFWDFESCSPAPTASGYNVVNNIRNMGHKFGSVTLLKAYLKLSEQSAGLRSELQSSGVSLIDYPTDGPADKMMLVDMLAYAIDNPPSATILLISADRGFAYAVSVLRLRRYRVVLAVPSAVGVHISLRSQASVVLDCNQDVPRSSMFRNGSFSGSQSGLEDVEASGLASHQEKLDNYPESPIITYAPSFSVTKCRDGGLLPQSSMLNTNGGLTKPRKPSGTLSESAPAGTSKCNIPARGRAQFGSSSINDKFISTVRNDTTGDSAIQPATLINHPGSWKAHSQLGDLAGIPAAPATDRDWKQKSSNENSSQVEASSSHETGNRPWVARPSLSSNMGNLVRNASPTSSHSPHIVSLASTITAELPPADVPSQPGAQINLTPVTTDPTISFIKPSGVSERDVEIEGSSLPIQVVPFTDPGDCPSQAMPSLVNSIQSLTKDARITTPASTPSRVADPIFAPGDLSCSNDHLPTVLLSKYRLLVEVLQNLRSSGNFLPLRSVVGAQLSTRNKLVYQEAGVVGFGQYIVSAERSGIVTIGGTGGKAWISLHPAWFRASPSLST